ncbi:DUF6318 family protein [Zhihengliuella flava]|uniref:DUF6318 domain-containing protein n=1 Tax=Zhihengliuella flava TaxID=1285193 RepID=A0A931GJ15_9MICC|nr:DUF6318 family protein [Zhihengliuella flava]MBG6084846.1 hypothetical protein [Zhihengliuella flava]
MQSSPSKRGTLAALGMAALLALSACGGEGTTPEPSSSGASPSASQTTESPSSSEPQEATPEHPARNLTPPEMPEEAKEFTEEGFAAFIEYWFEAQNYGIATGDGSYVEDVSHEECRGCNSALVVIDEVAQGGGEAWIVGGTMRATDVVSKLHGDESQMQRAYLTWRQINGDAYNVDGLMEGGRDVITDAVEPFIFEAYYADGGWTATRIEARES